MTGRVLVTYGSTHGSTAEVAAAVAGTLVEQGLAAVVLAARDVGNVAGYDGVVIGAAIYAGRLHRDVRRLLRRLHRELAELPVAVFAMGPLTLKEGDVAGSRRQLEHALARAADVQPVATAVFGGVTKPDELRFPFNHMPQADARDWEAINAWAREVSEAFARSPATLAG
jgi:menaquinone-dependent protoporphyrinogen oxidase